MVWVRECRGVSRRSLAIIASVLLYSVASVEAQILSDVTGDGQVEVLAFGDSITYGVGDGNNPGDYIPEITDAGTPRGYPKRVSATTGLPISNGGVPGERLVQAGLERFPSLVVGSEIDVVVFMEGVNDAVHQLEGSQYRRAVQRVINVARAEGKSLVLATLPPPTSSRASLALFTNFYSSIVKDLGVVNSLPVADVEQQFLSTCADLNTCELYNLPEGLHPNTAGYDAIAEVISATLAQ
jgi:lysophospholipase L1-like esterase